MSWFATQHALGLSLGKLNASLLLLHIHSYPHSQYSWVNKSVFLLVFNNFGVILKPYQIIKYEKSQEALLYWTYRPGAHYIQTLMSHYMIISTRRNIVHMDHVLYVWSTSHQKNESFSTRQIKTKDSYLQGIKVGEFERYETLTKYSLILMGNGNSVQQISCLKIVLESKK